MGFCEFEGQRPEVKESSFVHPQATMMDSVTIGEGCYVGARAELQRDWRYILIVPGSGPEARPRVALPL
jgi:phenylacetic acid degradation protein